MLISFYDYLSKMELKLPLYPSAILGNNQKNIKSSQNYIAIHAKLCYTICRHKKLA